MFPNLITNKPYLIDQNDLDAKNENFVESEVNIDYFEIRTEEHHDKVEKDEDKFKKTTNKGDAENENCVEEGSNENNYGKWTNNDLIIGRTYQNDIEEEANKKQRIGKLSRVETERTDENQAIRNANEYRVQGVTVEGHARERIAERCVGKAIDVHSKKLVIENSAFESYMPFSFVEEHVSIYFSYLQVADIN